MRKSVWIISQDASSPETGYGGRAYYFANSLAKMGYDVKLFAASYHHLMHAPPDVSSPYTVEVANGFSIVWIKVLKYNKPSSILRVINWFFFALRLRFLGKGFGDDPDVIIYSSPPLIGYFSASFLSKKFFSRLILDVRDIWPLTLVQLGGFSRKNPMIRLMQYIEDSAYQNSSAVVSNLSESHVHMCERGLDRSKFAWIPNGFDSKEVADADPLPDELVSLIPADKFVVGYTGSIGLANANDVLLKAAELLKGYNDIAFVFIGSGQEKPVMKDYADSHNLNNVVFLDRIPKRQVQSAISLFSCCFIGSKDEPIYRFGIGANKIPEYMFSGVPIVMSFSGNGNPVKSADCGLVVPSGNPKMLAEAILELYSMSNEDRKRIGRKGKYFAINNFDYDALAVKLSKLF